MQADSWLALGWPGWTLSRWRQISPAASRSPICSNTSRSFSATSTLLGLHFRLCSRAWRATPHSASSAAYICMPSIQSLLSHETHKDGLKTWSFSLCKCRCIHVIYDLNVLHPFSRASFCSQCHIAHHGAATGIRYMFRYVCPIQCGGQRLHQRACMVPQDRVVASLVQSY